MSASAAAITKTWQVGEYAATLTVSKPDAAGHRSAVIEWTPCVPQNLSSDDLDAYRRGRDAAFQAMGLRALVIET